MSVEPVTPIPGLASEVTTGGEAVIAVGAGPNGGVITNPATATAYLFVNPIDDAVLEANGNTFALAPGQSWDVIPGQTTPTSVNSSDNNHAFSVVSW